MISTKNGDPGASRTHNLFLRTELLYPLSYRARHRRVTALEGAPIEPQRNGGGMSQQDPSGVWYNYSMNLFKKKDDKKTEQEKVEERREEVLARGRKFKYPLQWTKHRIVTNTILIATIVVAILITSGWLALYQFGMTDEMLYRITKILPVPVASIAGENVKFSDYLLFYRSSILSIERQSGQADNDNSLANLRLEYKRAALNESESYTYAEKLAKELDIEVTQEEVSSEEGFLKIIDENFGLDKSEYEHMLYLTIIKAKVEMAINEHANKIATKVESMLAENGGNYAAVAEALGQDVEYQETGGMVSSQNIDGGRAAEAFKLEPGGQSGRFVSTNGDGYYFVKLIKKTDTEVNFVSIKVPFTEFDTRFATLREEGKIKEYINLTTNE